MEILTVPVLVQSLQIRKNVMEGMTGKVIRLEAPYVKLLTDPLRRDGRWLAVAKVDARLSLIEVVPVEEIVEELETKSAPESVGGFLD